MPSVEHLCALSRLLNVHMEELLVLQGQSEEWTTIEFEADSRTKRLLSYLQGVQKAA